MLLRDAIGGFDMMAHLLEGAEHNLTCLVVNTDSLEAYICHSVEYAIVTLFCIIATESGDEAALVFREFWWH